MKTYLRIGALIVITIATAVIVRPQTVVSDDPNVVAAAAPIFPVIAAAAKASGDVIIEVKIGLDGTVTSVRAVEGHALLRKVCELAARRWRFVAAKDSKAERVVRLTFTFREVDDKTPEVDRTPIFLPPYKVEVTGPKIVITTNTSH